jgi:hypothetical protein
VNVTAFEKVPLLESHIATVAAPAFATAPAGTTAVACMLFIKFVASFVPFQVTASPPLKLEPDTVRVKLPAPAVTAIGEIARMLGTFGAARAALVISVITASMRTIRLQERDMGTSPSSCLCNKRRRCRPAKLLDRVSEKG